MSTARFAPVTGHRKGLLATLAVAAAALVVATSASARGVSEARHLSFGALVSKAQFVNNRDDRERGVGNNPFGNGGGTGVATTNERGRGPLPGDEGLFEFTLTDPAKRSTKIGTGDLVCEYVFAKTGSCSFTYEFADGSIVGKGSFPALARTSFSLTVTGGTGAYRGARGTVRVTRDANALPSKTVSHNVPALVLEPERVSVTLAPAASTRATTLVRYSSATKEQFIDNGDDEVRGWATNPFAMRDPKLEAAEDADTGGPFPGDESLFGFAIRSQPKSAASNPATFTCLYAFSKRAFCNATFALPGGTLYGGGAFAFAAKRYSIAIAGGTGDFHGATGELDSEPGPNGTQRLAIRLAWPSGGGTTHSTYYSVAVSQQFVNNADDRLRGKGSNPFGNFHDNSPTTKQKKGPFPGDENIFAFDVASDSARKHMVGRGTFMCLYNFNENVYCDVVYQLPTGRVFASGAFDFAATSFTLTVTGGTGAYANRSGTIAATPAPDHGQKLALTLAG
ncbi:MAG TPA: hypothetical protein VHC01_10625 [Gaiellaceae bacterium]|jgi:hypothetical protein|nr:hypothetical protein [Gaiellaceae bacterium]